jgi:dihydroxyacetone kinase
LSTTFFAFSKMTETTNKQFINDKSRVVLDAIDGLLLSTPELARFDGFPDIKVVFDRNFAKNKNVACISGGGSGHEVIL